MSDEKAKEIAEMTGGKLVSVMDYGNGEGGCVVSFPLPKDHWIFSEDENLPPRHPEEWTSFNAREYVRAAARYAIRASIPRGVDPDFDPDAMAQNFEIGMAGFLQD